MPEQAYNCLLPSLLMKKLPRELALTISRKIPENEWNLTKIMEELGIELKARERAYDKSSSHELPKHKEHYRRGDSRDFSQRRSPVPPTTSAMLNPTGCCCYCAGSHTAEVCPKVSLAEERKQALRGMGRCFVCIKQGHLGRNCKSSSRCKHCNGRHHSSICFKGNTEKRERREDKTTSVDTSQLNPTAPAFKTASLLADDRGPILLQTAQALVYSPTKSRRATLKVIFDNGSQRSYITEHARDRLALVASGRKDMFIATFAAKSNRVQSCDVVKVIMEMKDGGVLRPVLVLSLFSLFVL